jgi:Uma2 family endonuclease
MSVKLLFIMGRGQTDGKVLVECAIKTSRGTKVAGVALASNKRFMRIKSETDASVAPEVCVEVLSRSNTDKEMREKRKLYFERGAHEV